MTRHEDIKWFHDANEVWSFGVHLVELGELATADVLSYFEKPWKWADEYDTYVVAMEAESPAQ